MFVYCRWMLHRDDDDGGGDDVDDDGVVTVLHAVLFHQE